MKSQLKLFKMMKLSKEKDSNGCTDKINSDLDQFKMSII
jgi:hypothetical protein